MQFLMGIEEINISYGHKLILMLINKIFVNFLVQFFVQLIIYMVLIFGYINHLFCFMKYQFYFSILKFFFNFSKKLNIKYYVEFIFSFFFSISMSNRRPDLLTFFILNLIFFPSPFDAGERLSQLQSAWHKKYSQYPSFSQFRYFISLVCT